MKRYILLIILMMAVIFCSGCSDDQYSESDQAPSSDDGVISEVPKTESTTDSASEEQSPSSQSHSEGANYAEIFTGNIEPIPALDGKSLYHLDTWNGFPVHYRVNGSRLDAEQYDLDFGNSHVETIHDFGEESILSYDVGEDSLVVITDRAAYRFNENRRIAAEAELPFELLDDELRMDYFRKSFVVNHELTWVVYQTEEGLYSASLTEEQRPTRLVEHPYVPTGGSDEVQVAIYTPLRFISEQEVLVAVGGWEWWGQFSIIRVDTGEIWILTDKRAADLIYSSQEAVYSDNEDAMFHLDYQTGTITDASFLAEHVRLVDSRGAFDRFYNPKMFLWNHITEGETGFTLRHIDYAEGTVTELPFRVNADDCNIIWVSPSGDILFSYRLDRGRAYAMARAE